MWEKGGTIYTLYRSIMEYDRVSSPQDFTAPAKENGGAFTWEILILCLMKQLSGRPAESRKPWTRFTALQQAYPNCRH